MAETLSVRSRATPSLRCAVCHDAAGAHESCGSCASVFHAECRRSLVGCPTLGCFGRTAEETARRADPAEEVRLFSWSGALLASAVSTLATLAAAFLAGTARTPEIQVGTGVGALALAAFHAVGLPIVLVSRAHPRASLVHTAFCGFASVLFVASTACFASVLLASLDLTRIATLVAALAWAFGPAVAAAIGDQSAVDEL